MLHNYSNKNIMASENSEESEEDEYHRLINYRLWNILILWENYENLLVSIRLEIIPWSTIKK